MISASGLLATAEGDGSTLWTVDDPRVPRLVGGPMESGNSALSAVALDADGRVAAVSTPGRSAGLVDLSDPAHPRPVGTPLADDGDTVLDLAYARTGHLLAVAGDAVTLWDTTDPAHPRSVATLPDHVVFDTSYVGPALVRFDPTSQLLAVLYADRTVVLWDIRDPARPAALGRPIQAPQRAGLRIGVSAVAFTGDGGGLALGYSDGTFEVLDITRSPPFDPIIGVTPNPPTDEGDGLALDVAADTPVVGIGLTDETVILWDISDPHRPVRVGPPLDAASAAKASDLTFAPNHLLISADGDGNIVVRDISDALHPVVLGVPVGSDPVSSTDGGDARFDAGTFSASADGRTVVSGGWSGRELVVDVGSALDLRDHARERACTIVGRGLNSDEWGRFAPEVPYRPTCPG